VSLLPQRIARRLRRFLFSGKISGLLDRVEVVG
jgi:hypothetical protein